MIKVIQSSISSETEVIIFSKRNQLTETIVDELKNKDSKITKFDLNSSNTEWRVLSQKVKENKNNNQFYLLTLIGYPLDDIDGLQENIQKILSLAENNNSKTLFVFPRNLSKELINCLNSLEKSLTLKRNVYSGTIFLGDLLSSEFDKQSLSNLNEKVKNSVFSKSLILPDKEVIFYPLSVADAAKFLVASLFSMGSYRRKSQILGEPLSANQIANIISDFRKDLVIKFTQNTYFNPTDIQENRFVKFSLQDFLSELYKNREDIIKNELSEPVFSEPFQKQTGEHKEKEFLTKFRELLTEHFTKNSSFLFQNLKKTSLMLYKIISGISFNKLSTVIRKFKDLLKFPVSIKHPKILLAEQKEETIKLPDETNTMVAYSQSLPEKLVNSMQTRRRSKLFIWGFAVVLILFSPFLLYLFSSLLFAFSGMSLNKGYLENAETFSGLSGFSSSVSQKTSWAFGRVPVVGGLFRIINQKSNEMVAAVDINSGFLKIVKGELSLVDSKLLGDKSKKDKVNDLSLEIKSLYEKLSFWETDLNNPSQNKDYFTNPLFSNVTISELRSKLLTTLKLFDQANVLLGESRQVNYLLLLQNNDVIKPAGGNIESFAVLTLSAGEVTDLQFFDTADLNPDYKIESDVPLVLEKYFGKNDLKFEDTNIYTDFTLSAQKAEWYIDKILNLPIDGVIAFDGDALSELGSKGGDDKTQTIALEKLDKAYFEKFTSSLVNGSSKEKLVRLLKLEQILKRKQIIVFLNDSQAQKAIDDLGWNGSVKTADCSNYCYEDIVGITEFSEDIGSKNLERELDLEVSFQENLIKRKLDFFLENKNDFIYKTYIKLVANPDSGFSPVKVSSDKESLVVNPDTLTVSGFKEAGVFIELQPKETKVLSFIWESGIEDISKQEYSLFVRRQPGIKDYMAKIKLNKKNLDSLTDEGSWDYNTLLSSDFETYLNLGNDNY